MTIMEVEIDIMDRLDTATFDELAATILGSIQRAGKLARASLDELINAGGALIAMRERMPGKYREWLEQQDIDAQWAAKCTRLYTYRDHIPPFETLSTPHGQKAALDSIRHLPSLVTGNRARRVTDEQYAAAKQLVSAGATRQDAAKLMGISPTALTDALRTPAERAEHKKKYRAKATERRAASIALRLQEERRQKDQLAKANGKELSVAYSAVRKALAALDTAEHGVSVTHKNRATRYLTAAEAAIVSALRAERTD